MALQRQTKELYIMQTDNKLRVAELNGIIRESLIEIINLHAAIEGDKLIDNANGEVKMSFAVITTVEDDDTIGCRKMAFGCDFLEKRDKEDIPDENKISFVADLEINELATMGVINFVDENQEKISGKAVEMHGMVKLVKKLDALKSVLTD
ncbi:MAG: hypothetical protein J7K90_09720 [Desulfuromusa sp.]|nr:hypothetical protein [Desulfuromusa sp.]